MAITIDEWVASLSHPPVMTRVGQHLHAFAWKPEEGLTTRQKAKAYADKYGLRIVDITYPTESRLVVLFEAVGWCAECGEMCENRDYLCKKCRG